MHAADDDPLVTGLNLGEAGWMGQLFPLVYRELKAVAHRQLGRAPGNSIDTTGLVHEAYLKLSNLNRSAVENRAHFLAISGRAMRQVLVAAARKRRRLKRGSGQEPVTLTETDTPAPMQLEDVLVINDALERLQHLDERLGRLVECRFFAGLTEEETAEALGISVSSVQRDWRRAKAWLRRYLKSPRDAGDGGR